MRGTNPARRRTYSFVSFKCGNTQDGAWRSIFPANAAREMTVARIGGEGGVFCSRPSELLATGLASTRPSAFLVDLATIRRRASRWDGHTRRFGMLGRRVTDCYTIERGIGRKIMPMVKTPSKGENEGPLKGTTTRDGAVQETVTERILGISVAIALEGSDCLAPTRESEDMYSHLRGAFPRIVQ